MSMVIMMGSSPEFTKECPEDKSESIKWREECSGKRKHPYKFPHTRMGSISRPYYLILAEEP
jgi:hypothetical protein